MLTTVTTCCFTAELERQEHAATEIQKIARGRAARAKKKDSKALATEKAAEAEAGQKEEEEVVQEAEAGQKEEVAQEVVQQAGGEPSAQGLTRNLILFPLLLSLPP